MKHISYDILKFLTGGHDIKFNIYHGNESPNCCYMTFYKMREKHLVWRSVWCGHPDVIKGFVIRCEKADSFERQCQMFLETCLEAAQRFDVIATNGFESEIILRKGTTLEQVLIEMDMQIA